MTRYLHELAENSATPLAMAIKHAIEDEPHPLVRRDILSLGCLRGCLDGGHLQEFTDQSMASCVDAQTGEERYRERLGGNFNASPLAADGRIYATSREGVTHVLAAGPEFRKLAENKLDGQQWATMAAVDGAFFIRTDTALYRISTPHP